VAVTGRPWLLVAAFVLGAIVGLAAGGLWWGFDAPQVGERLGDPEMDPRPLEVPGRGLATADPADGSEASAKIGGSPSDVDPRGEPDSTSALGLSERGWIEVRATYPDGSPLTDGTAYALPARGRGVDDPSDCPTAEIEETGARIPIEIPGLYDVGVRYELLAGMRTDVRVRAGTTIRVEIVLPPAAPVVVRVDGGDLAWKGLQGSVLLRSSEEEAVGFPGRNDLPSLYDSITVREPGQVESEPVPVGRRLAVSTYLQESVEDPEQSRVHRQPIFSLRTHPSATLVPDRLVIRAGEELRISPAPVGLLAWRFSPDQLLRDRPVRATVHVRDGEREYDVTRWTSGREASDLLVTSQEIHLAWTGPGLVAGEERIQVPLGRRVERDIAVRSIADAWIPVDLSGTPENPGTGESLRFFAALEARASSEQVDSYDHDAEEGRPPALPPAWRSAVSLVASLGEGLASDPVVPPSSGGVGLAFRPAGSVVVLVDRDVDPNAGSLTVSLPDGRPLLSTNGDGYPSPIGVVARVQPGTRIGPLPEGEHVFQVRIGGAPLPDVQVRVRAGRIVPLHIRR
jgi:hypothetical protein